MNTDVVVNPDVTTDIQHSQTTSQRPFTTFNQVSWRSRGGLQGNFCSSITRRPNSHSSEGSRSWRSTSQNHSNDDKDTTNHFHSTTQVKRNAVILGAIIYETCKHRKPAVNINTPKCSYEKMFQLEQRKVPRFSKTVKSKFSFSLHFLRKLWICYSLHVTLYRLIIKKEQILLTHNGKLF